MPNYRYKHPEDGCEFTAEWTHDFHLVTKIDDRDKAVCPCCNAPLTRQFEGTTAVKYEHLSVVEKAMKKDLTEANNLEKEKAYGGRTKDDQARITKEVNKLTYI